MSTSCIEYDFSLLDLLIPSRHIIYKLCISRNKTTLFIVSTLRMLFWGCIFLFFYKKGIVEWNYNKSLRTIGFSIFLLILIVNIGYLILVVFKKPAIDKYLMDENSTELANYLDDAKLTGPSRVTQIDMGLSAQYDPIYSPTPVLPSRIIDTEDLLANGGTFITEKIEKNNTRSSNY